MANVLIVQISQGLANLFEEEASVLLRQDALRAFELDVLIEADSADEFLHQVDVLGCLEVIEELHNVRVFELLHACDLSLHGLALGGIIQLILWVYLYRYFRLGLLMLCKLNIRVRP